MAGFIEVVVLLPDAKGTTDCFERPTFSRRQVRTYNVEAIRTITRTQPTVQAPEFNRCRMVAVVGDTTHDLLVESRYEDLLALIDGLKSSEIARATLTPQAASEVL